MISACFDAILQLSTENSVHVYSFINSNQNYLCNNDGDSKGVILNVYSKITVQIFILVQISI